MSETFRPLFSESSDFLPEEPLGESLLYSEDDLRVWIPKSPVLVLGRSQKAEREINLEASCSDSIPVFKRHGGGGCVLLDDNSLCIGFRYERKNGLTVNDYLEHSVLGVADFIASEYDLDTTMGSNYDLLIGDRKILGSSLYMPKGSSIYLAVILFKKEAMIGINKYLGMPSKEPEHRRGRSHSDFLTPLGEHIDDSIDNFRQKLEDFMRENCWTSGPHL